jgi:hypothetical protein
MLKLFTSSFVFIALFCVGCATTESKESIQKNEGVKTTAITAEAARPQPDWVTGESKDYPRLDYLTARTQGATANEASLQAQAKLSRMFMADLTQYDMSERQALECAGYELNRTFQSETAMTVAAPEIERILGKIKVVDQWYDSNTKTHHALATLARNTSLGYLRSQIQMLDTNTQDFLKSGHESSDPLTKMGIMALAWRSQQLRTALQESMRDVDLTRRGIESQWELESLRKEINTLLVNLKIYPSGVAGDANAQLMSNTLNSALKTADLKPTTEKQADYLLSATVDVAIIGERNGWAVGQGTIKLVLADKENKTRGSKEWIIEIPGLDEEAARRRVMEKSEYTLKREMRNSLIDMALGE